jgi:hypothetical protein
VPPIDWTSVQTAWLLAGVIAVLASLSFGRFHPLLSIVHLGAVAALVIASTLAGRALDLPLAWGAWAPPVATIMGTLLILGAAHAWCWTMAWRAERSGELHETFVDRALLVTAPIAPGGTGEVSCVLRGSRQFRPARCHTACHLERGARAVGVEYASGIVYVAALPEWARQTSDSVPPSREDRAPSRAV